MNIADRLKTAAQLLLGRKATLKTFPPLVMCPICSGRTKWIVQDKLWGCANSHRFSVRMHANPATPDKSARDYRGETEI